MHIASRRPRAVWAGSWIGAAALGVANGTAREALYARRVGERPAHQISTGTLLVAVAAYTAALQRRTPLDDPDDALAIGAVWLTLTVLFEFGFGHYVAHESWRSLLANYDVRRGRIWILVPLAMVVLPWLTRPRR